MLSALRVALHLKICSHLWQLWVADDKFYSFIEGGDQVYFSEKQYGVVAEFNALGGNEKGIDFDERRGVGPEDIGDFLYDLVGPLSNW